ncbi:MAG: 2,3,4,5-tetrahydropyridine-2,6-dicarboxylate N-succinyltransferase [Bacteroidota bacterium]
MSLKDRIQSLFEDAPDQAPNQFESLFSEFLSALEDGSIRSAEPTGDDSWKVNHWVKQGILLGFKYGQNQESGSAGSLHFFDKHTYPTLKPDGVQHNIRIVPGGSSVRAGSFIGNNVTMMPPMYVNTGAYVDDNTMIDSHALVGSCAQVGKRVHLSAAAQLGGVLEPIGALPVIVEDDCMIGGNCGIYEGTQIGAGAVVGAGVILTKSTPVYDLVRQEVYRATDEAPLRIPEGAVVIPGSRTIKGHSFAEEQGLAISTPIIIKYRDDKTDDSTTLEELLR